MKKFLSLLLIVTLASAVRAVAADQDSQYADLYKKLAQPAGSTSEADVMQLIKLAHATGHPLQASIIVKNHLAQNRNPSPALIRLAAENAWDCVDVRTAISRYKTFLRAADAGADSGAAAARLYSILIDFTRDKEDAYQFMRENGEKFRQSPAARRYDFWFVTEARTRRDYASLLRRLGSILNDKMPADQEQFYFSDSIDWALNELTRCTTDQLDLSPQLRTMAGSVRDNKARALKLDFVSAHLAYCASRRGKTDDAPAQDFEPVLTAARAMYDAAPNAATLQFILRTFSGGPDIFNETRWRDQQKSKQDFFVASFAKLNDADRVALMTWKPYSASIARYLATRDQWADLGAKYPALFSVTDNVRDIPFVTNVKDLAQAQAEAAFLKNVATRPAAVVNSLANGADLTKAGLYLLNNQSWFLPLDSIYDTWDKDLAPAGTALYKANPGNVRTSTFEFVTEMLTKTPIALYDRKFTRTMLVQLWWATPEKPKLLEIVKGLNWVPGAANDRKDIFSGLVTELKTWQGTLRQQKDETSQALLKSSAELDAFLQSALTNNGQIASAPSPLSQKLAAMEQARLAKDNDAYVKAAQEVYALVKDYDVKKTPFGAGVLTMLLRSPEGFNVTDFQAQILADQLATADAANVASRIRLVMESIRLGRNWGDWTRVPAPAKPDVAKINGVLETALSAMIDKGQFDPEVFNFYRISRLNPDAGGDLIGKMIEKRVYINFANRPKPEARCAALAYLGLLRNDFVKFADKYSPDTVLDDVFIEEATKTGYLDAGYIVYTHDTKHKIANLAAKMLTKFDALPIGDDGGKTLYRREEISQWIDFCMAADGPVRDALIAKMESGAEKTRFDAYAFGSAYFASITNVPRKEFFDKLTAYVNHAKNAPARLPAPGLNALPHLVKNDVYTDAEDNALTDLVLNASPAEWPRGYDEVAVGLLVTQLAHGQTNDLFTLLPSLAWMTRDTVSLRRILQTADAAFKAKQYDLAVAGTVSLLEFGGSLPDDARGSAQTIRIQSVSNIGGGNPVDQRDPRYPVYAAQSDYNIGNLTGAWEGFLSRSERGVEMIKELDPRFVIWLIQRAAEERNFDLADNLARAFLPWMDNPASGADAELRGSALIAYADISFYRQEYPKARALYERVDNSAEFENTQAKPSAELKIADVNRLTKQYDKALEILDKLTRRKERDIQTEAYYRLALLNFDRDQYQDARKQLDQVFLRQPDFANARLLEGQLNLKMKHLLEATQLQVGLSSAQRLLVPGQPLRVRLEDQNLSTVGKSDSIEIHAWTDSGDDEVFNLTPFGDSKTKFEGNLNTGLGAIAKGDHILQVFGGDAVHYDFSDRFKKSHNISGDPITLTVASDSELYVSSGQILTQEEQAQKQLEEMLQMRLRITNENSTALSLARPSNQIKPGNKINVRVIDPDQNTTPGKDKVRVSVASSSGDSISGFELEETGPTTGIFEGAIPTASAPAKAYATDSMEGRLPDSPISAGNHGAWQGDSNNQRPKLYSVDLKDNVLLGKLHLQADVQGRKLKRFSLQTSLNGRQFQTLATYPDAFVPWDGTLKFEMMKYSGKTTPQDTPELISWLQTAGMEQGQRLRTLPINSLSVNLDPSLGGQGDAMQLQPTDLFVSHLQGAFNLSARASRTFRVEIKDAANGTRYAIAIDGDIVERQAEKRGPRQSTLFNSSYEFKRSLGKGVHRIDIYAIAARRTPPKFELQWDTDKPPYMVICPIESFDPKKDPEIAKQLSVTGATLQPSTDGTAFDVTFAPESRARVVRFLLEDFESDAPAIGKLTLTDAAGKTILPTEQDLTTLNQNQVLEIVPGDRILVKYTDPKVVTPGTQIHAGAMQATYANGTLTAAYIEYTGEGSARKPEYIPLRRFKPGEAINIVIEDPDEDVSADPDKVMFTAKIPNGKPVTIEALETEPHSGVFMGRIFPVKGEPQRSTELKVGDNEDVTVTYLDKDNTDPGVPWERTAVIEQASWVQPQLRVYNVDSTATKNSTATKVIGVNLAASETYNADRIMASTRPAGADAAAVSTNLIEAPLQVEVLWPTIALSSESTATIYIQTTTAIKQAGKQPGADFDPAVPGTVKVSGAPSEMRRFDPPPGYQSVAIRGDTTATDPLSDGRFSYSIPLKLGDIADQTSSDTITDGGSITPTVNINGTDELLVGFQYKDQAGQPKWLTRRVVLGGDSFLDVMDRKYLETQTGAHVGETLYFRVLDKTKHVTSEKNAVDLKLTSSSGSSATVKAVESVGDSGIFKGYVMLVFAQDKESMNQSNVFAVNYGDTVTVSYASRPEAPALNRQVLVYKGADGEVLPFTKRYKDSEIAVQTQFTIAESYFELAKKHRELNEETLVRREIAQGKKVLEEALRDYPDTKLKAQADYLLANLSLEFATMATDAEAKRKSYLEAVARFSDLVATYPDSTYAPKSQFKKALTFERMGQIDQACEEYVKLSYRYPDNELVAETIVRLGQYFFTKGKALADQAETQTDKVQAEKLRINSRAMFTTAAEVFGRLAVRFPGHAMAAKSVLLSGQCYMRAEDFDKTIKTLKTITEDTNGDKEVRSEAMYWCGDAFMKYKDPDSLMNAYKMFKRLTWDYPESKWAKFARGRLTEDALSRVEANDAEKQ